MNIVEISGRLTREPELRFVGQQQNFPILELNVAVDDGYGRWSRDTRKTEVGSGFYQVEIPGQYGEALVEQLEKGGEVYVKGSLTQWTKENQDGSKESKTRIRADIVIPRGGPRPQQQIQTPAYGAAQPDAWATAAPAQQRGYTEEPPF